MLKISGIIMRPLVICVVAVGVIVIILTALVPYFARTFATSGIKPPLTTRIVMGLSVFLVNTWYWFLLAIFLSAFFLKTKMGKKIWDGLILKIPVISLIIKKINIVNTIKPLASLVIAGRPVAEALETISRTVKNFYYQKAIIEVAEKVKRGEHLSSAFKNYPELYPLTVSQAIEVGEEEDKIAVVLEKLGNFFEAEALSDVNALKKKTELLLMILLGGIVGFLAVSLIQPLILF